MKVHAPHRASRWLAALLAGLMAATSPAGAQVRLPAMGDGTDTGMLLGDERRLGERVVLEIRRDPAYLDDPILTDYVRGLWQPLLAAAQRRGEIGADMQRLFAWDAFLIRDRSINAFALPGGYVGVHLGLIASTATRDELVSVMAHELTHVTQRHIARSIESAGRQSALGLAAMLLGVIAASRSSNIDVARAAIAGGQAAMIQGQLNFSRDMEREADRIGQTLMRDAGFDAAGMPAMFEQLDKAYRLSDAGAFPYLRSHPLTVERIAESQARAGVGQQARLRQDIEHELMRARARVLMDPGVTALRAHVQALASRAAVADRAGTGAGVPAAASSAASGAASGAASAGAPAAVPDGVGVAYAAALAGVLLQDVAATRAGLLALEPAARTQPVVARWTTLLRLEAALAATGQATAAGAIPLPPPPLAGVSTWQRPELRLWGQALLARPADAGSRQLTPGELHQALRSWLVAHPGDGPVWELLARYEEARGNRMAMLRATAEAHAANGQVDAALITLQSARSQARRDAALDPVELAVVDARLAELRRQRQAREGRENRDGRDGRDGRDRGD